MELRCRPNRIVNAQHAAPVSSIAPAFELSHIDKHYGFVHALQDVSLVVRAGTVHALLKCRNSRGQRFVFFKHGTRQKSRLALQGA